MTKSKFKKEKKTTLFFFFLLEFLEADHNFTLNKQNAIGKATQGVEGRNVGGCQATRILWRETGLGRGTRKDLDSLSYIS